MTPDDSGKVGMLLDSMQDGYSPVGLIEAIMFSAGDTTNLSRRIAQTLPYVVQTSIDALINNRPNGAASASAAVRMTGYPILGIFGLPALISLTYKVITDDWRQVTMLFTMISIDLALLNLMPLPGLDGGHFVATIINAVRKGPGKERKTLRILRVLFQGLMVTSGCPLCLLSGWRTRQKGSESRET
jgi:Peptidase family M50.